MRANAFTSIVGGNDGEWLELCYDKNDSASDSFTIMALYKFTYLLTYVQQWFRLALQLDRLGWQTDRSSSEWRGVVLVWRFLTVADRRLRQQSHTRVLYWTTHTHCYIALKYFRVDKVTVSLRHESNVWVRNYDVFMMIDTGEPWNIRLNTHL